MDSLENEKHSQRLQLFIVTSILAYFFWFSLVSPPPVQPAQELPESVTGDVTEGAGKPSEKVDASTIKSAVQTETKQVSSTIRKVEFAEAGIESDEVTVKISSKDGAMTNLSLPEYSVLPTLKTWWGWIFDGMEVSWEPYVGGEETLSILSEEGALVAVGRGDTLYRDVYSVSSFDERTIVSKSNVNGLLVTKTFKKVTETDDISRFLYDVEVQIENRTGETVSDIWIGAFDKMAGEAGRFTNDARPQFHVEDELYGTFGTMFSTSFLDVEDLEVDTVVEKEPVWAGIGSRYFLVAFQALETGVFRSVSTKKVEDDIYGSAAYLKNSLDSGATRTINLRVFAGPKILDMLEDMGPEWTDAVEFGMFGFFSNILLWLLKGIQSWFVNWGVSILLLTLIVKVLFFPLTQKAFVSGKKMQALQPKLKEVKEKYKDNQNLQAQETMKIFQEHGVSPLGGCLPTLIQIPVWFALYNVMLYSVELYDSSFLYLQDLTSVDPYGGLPIVYCVLMLIQQRMMPMGNMDPAQQQVLKMMPFLFGVFMFTFPSGLVLYFSMNILLTIFQQWLIRVQFDDEKLLKPTSE